MTSFSPRIAVARLSSRGFRPRILVLALAAALSSPMALAGGSGGTDAMGVHGGAGGTTTADYGAAGGQGGGTYDGSEITAPVDGVVTSGFGNGSSGGFATGHEDPGSSPGGDAGGYVTGSPSLSGSYYPGGAGEDASPSPPGAGGGAGGAGLGLEEGGIQTGGFFSLASGGNGGAGSNGSQAGDHVVGGGGGGAGGAGMLLRDLSASGALYPQSGESAWLTGGNGGAGGGGEAAGGGGMGGDGLYVIASTPGLLPSIMLQSSAYFASLAGSGGAGGNAGNGQTGGGTGGQGGNALHFRTQTSDSSTSLPLKLSYSSTLYGGAGGVGGNAGTDAGDGGDGGNAVRFENGSNSIVGYGATMTGGSGGNGGNANAGHAGNGGAGGAAIYSSSSMPLSLQADSTDTSLFTRLVDGGAGGNGGNSLSPSPDNAGGIGGRGGDAIHVEFDGASGNAPSITFDESNAVVNIAGGAGGMGGSLGDHTGDGGDGGNGITIVNTGDPDSMGGNRAMIDLGGKAEVRGGSGKRGGAGIEGANLQVQATSGSLIVGGLNGDGVTRAPGIHLTGGENNVISLDPAVPVTGGIQVDKAATTVISSLDATGHEFSAQLMGDGALTFPSSISLSADNTFTGTASVQDGATLQVDGSGSIGTFGQVSLASLASIDISGSDNSAVSMPNVVGEGTIHIDGKTADFHPAAGQTDVFDGQIVDSPVYPGSLIMSGEGTLVLNGVNTYAGNTTISKGTLMIGDADHGTASLASAQVLVDRDGTLRGHGTVLGDVNNGGTVWPGGSLGILTIHGNYAQTPDGTLKVDVSPLDASMLKVQGSATLAGTLQMLYGPGTYTLGKTYKVVQGGTVTGKFGTVQNMGIPSGLATVSGYDPETATITLVQSATPPDPTPTPDPTPSQPRTVVVAPTNATIFGAQGQALIRAGQRLNETLLGRLDRACASPRDTACVKAGNDRRIWAMAQGGSSRAEGNHGAPEAKEDRYGFLAGVDVPVKGWVVGGAFGYSHGSLRESSANSDLDTLSLSGYASRFFGPLRFSAALGAAYDAASTTRQFGAFGDARGDQHGQSLHAALKAGLPVALAKTLTLTPSAGMRYAYLRGLDGNESGKTSQNLDIGRQTVQSLQPVADLALDYAVRPQSGKPIHVGAHVQASYETLSTGRNVSVTASDGTPFVITGSQAGRTQLETGAFASFSLGKHTDVGVRYDVVLPAGGLHEQVFSALMQHRF